MWVQEIKSRSYKSKTCFYMLSYLSSPLLYFLGWVFLHCPFSSILPQQHWPLDYSLELGRHSFALGHFQKPFFFFFLEYSPRFPWVLFFKPCSKNIFPWRLPDNSVSNFSLVFHKCSTRNSAFLCQYGIHLVI